MVVFSEHAQEAEHHLNDVDHEYDGKMYRCLVQSTALGNKYGSLCLFQYALKFVRKLKPWWQTSGSHGKSSLPFALYFCEAIPVLRGAC